MTLIGFQRFLNQRRLRYAFILAAAMWIPWLISILAGPGNMDLAGHPIGADYLQFYVAGHAVRTGESVQLYDLSFQWALQQQLLGSDTNLLYGFITPPHLAWLYVPFSMLPYGLSFALWAMFSLGLLWTALRLLVATSSRPFVWALTWYVTYTSISYGQNSLLSLFILSATFWLWKRQRPLAAGLMLSLLMYKPQLTVGVLLLWLLEWRRDRFALMGLALGALLTAVLSFWLLPDASTAYLTFARTVLPGLPQWLDFPLWRLHTIRGFWHLLLPGALPVADALTVVIMLVGLLGFFAFWRRCRAHRELMYAAAVCVTWWLTPHAMIYDLVILLIPAWLLWAHAPEARNELRAIYALAWLATLLSPPLNVVQALALPFGVQITVPVLGLCIYLIWRRLQELRQRGALFTEHATAMAGPSS